jgi:hypothetical protein
MAGMAVRTPVRHRGRALVAGIAPIALCVVLVVVAAIAEGDAAIAASAPVLALWCFGLPLAAGISAWRADADEWRESRTVLILVLVATAAWVGLVVATASSTSALGMLILPVVQGVAWGVGSLFGD